MERELSILEDYLPEQTSVRKPSSRTKDRAKATTSFTSKIGLISRNGLLLNLRQPGIEVFSITLDILDRAIEDQQDEQDLQEQTYPSLELLKQKVPPFLHCYLDF
jgi:hypothetical protein